MGEAEYEEDEVFDYYVPQRMMSMVHNLAHSRKRLVRRLVKLRWAWEDAPLAVQESVTRAAVELLQGKITPEQIRQQYRQHPWLAEPGVRALSRISGGALIPREPN